MTSPRTYLHQLNSNLIRLGLEPITKLLASLHNPQHNYVSILVGGTNGKGSIAATVAAILEAGGYRVGLYTSPHLVDLRERIRVNGEMIAEAELDCLIDEVRQHVGEEVSYFEFFTAVAFLYFYRRQVDMAILEVGLGGRLDATNVVKPLLSIISNISLEHQEYLGKRLEDIAGEKGGIIRQGGVCLTAAKQRSVLKKLTEICRERQAVLYRVGKDVVIRCHRDGTFSYQGLQKSYARLFCFLKGRHQMDNAALALAAIEIVAARGWPVSDLALLKGMAAVKWEGRLEVLQAAPQVVVDGGHNLAGIAALCRALQEDFTYRRLILVFGVLSDKNYTKMLKHIAPLAYMVIITRPETERAVPPRELEELAGSYCRQVKVIEQPRQALAKAMKVADKEDLICVTGSLYLVGDIKRDFAGNNT